MADEFTEYKRAISQYPKNRTVNVILPNEMHRYHVGPERIFAAVMRPDGEFIRFIPVVRFH